MAGALGRRLIFPSEKRGAAVGIGRKGKGTNLFLLTDGHNLPLGVYIASADRHESTQVVPLIDRAVISWLQKLRRLIVCYEYHADLFLGMAQLACLFTLIQRF